MLIEQEMLKQGPERNIKVLDQLLTHLNYFKRMSTVQKEGIYIYSDLITCQAQQVIFNEGDIGDYMYIILKGKISVEKKMEEK